MKIQNLSNEQLIKKQAIYDKIKLISKIVGDTAVIACLVFTIISEVTTIPDNVSIAIAFTLFGIWFLNLIPLIACRVVLAKIRTLLDKDETLLDKDEENAERHYEFL